MKTRLALLAASCLALLLSPAHAQNTWNLGGGGSWNIDTNWSLATVPNAVGASISFNGLATGSNPEQIANRTITLDATQTVGSIVFNTDLSTFTNTLAAGTGGSLTFDAPDAGPATILTTGSGSGNNTFTNTTGNLTITLADSLVATVNNTSATSGAGSLNFTAAMTGPGGFTKEGDGTATFGTNAKTYLGPTVLNGGRMRISIAARPQNTSSFTVNANAQLTLIAASGTLSLGNGPLILNGDGPNTGPISAFRGAIRNETSFAAVITNPSVVLQSNTLLHIQGAATGSINFTGSISGPGQLALTSALSDANLGTLILSADNSYSGGTLIRGGLVTLGSATADLGTGNVEVLSAHLMFAGASARLQIPAGTLNAIADTATLSLAGGNAFGIADDGYLDLGFGVNEVVGALFLGGSPKVPGTYGALGSGAMFESSEYFTGSGIVTVVPEPATASLLALSLTALAIRRRRTSLH